MTTPTHEPLAWIAAKLERLEKAGLRRHLAERSSAQTAEIVLDGRRLVNFGSNDYLGLAADERLAAAASTAIQREGWGSGASPLVSGRATSHAELERRLAQFEGTEAALVFPSGYAANVGTIAALVGKPDAIYSDAKNHASLIDGCRLSKAASFVYPHRDMAALESLLGESADYRRRLIVSDTLFSMDGDLAPLAELVELAERFDAMLLVDEAHATGVFGEHGRGVAEGLAAGSLLPLPMGEGRGEGISTAHPHLNPLPEGEGTELHDRVHIRVGTLSKALGSGGGFVCGERPLVDWLANRARSYAFSTAQPAATSAAALAALEIVEQEPERRQQLLQRAADLRMRLHDQGWNTGDSESQIIPIMIGDADRTMQLAADLREAGLFVPGIRPPSVPVGESLLRITLCHHHTPELVDQLLAALGRFRP